jgi:hypothetical protein
VCIFRELVVARAVYPHELQDPDFAWLIDSFKENHPEYRLIDSSCLPVCFIKEGNQEIYKELVTASAMLPAHEAALAGAELGFGEDEEDFDFDEKG